MLKAMHLMPQVQTESELRKAKKWKGNDLKMKRSRRFVLCSMMITMLLGLAALTGCGGKGNESQEVKPSSETVSESSTEPKGNSSAEEESSSAAPSVVVQLAEDGFYHVSSTEVLLEAIRPGVGIIRKTRIFLTEDVRI